MKRKLTAVLIPAALLLLAGAAYLFFTMNFLVLDGTVYHRETETLDLSNQTVEDFRSLSSLTGLKLLDLRGTQLTPEDYIYLSDALPDCRILWLVPFQGQYLPTQTSRITVSSLTEADIAQLSWLPELKTVDATGCQDYSLILKLQSAYPDCKVLYQKSYGSTVLDQDATAFSSTSAQDIADALAIFPGVTAVDAAGCQEFDALLALQSQYPGCHISYEILLEGTLYRETTTSLSLLSPAPADIAKALAYLPLVTSIRIQEPVTDLEAMAALKSQYPDIAYDYSFDFLNMRVTNRETSLDISGIKLDSTAIFDTYMPHFDTLEKVDMCNCGIPDEEMGALNDRYPDTLFVWLVRMGSFHLRTDIIYFMPWKYSYEVTDADVDSLKYLTELICLDLGHMEITDTSFLANMPKMQYLMLGCSTVSDISYCANMPDLVYLEIFTSNVTDFSPLLHCKKLVDLNVCHTKPSDPLIFCQMTQLENLWYNGDCGGRIKSALLSALPNTRIVFTNDSSTGLGWRKLPNYYRQRDIMDMFYLDD